MPGYIIAVSILFGVRSLGCSYQYGSTGDQEQLVGVILNLGIATIGILTLIYS